MLLCSIMLRQGKNSAWSRFPDDAGPDVDPIDFYDSAHLFRFKIVSK